MATLLDFEKPIAELESKVKELRLLADGSELDLAEEITQAREPGRQAAGADLRQAQPVAEDAGRAPPGPAALPGLCRGPDRGLHAAGRRPRLRRRPAIIGGLARFRGLSVVVVGHEKGRETEDRVRHNFGMARPEGYRKAMRLMRLAERFRPAGPHLRRHAGRASGHRRRGARPGRGDRALDRDLPDAERAARGDRDRRGRLGRGDRARGGRRHPDARARHLLGDLARGLRRRSSGAAPSRRRPRPRR